MVLNLSMAFYQTWLLSKSFNCLLTNPMMNFYEPRLLCSFWLFLHIHVSQSFGVNNILCLILSRTVIMFCLGKFAVCLSFVFLWGNDCNRRNEYVEVLARQVGYAFTHSFYWLSSQIFLYQLTVYIFAAVYYCVESSFLARRLPVLSVYQRYFLTHGLRHGWFGFTI